MGFKQTDQSNLVHHYTDKPVRLLGDVCTVTWLPNKPLFFQTENSGVEGHFHAHHSQSWKLAGFRGRPTKRSRRSVDHQIAKVVVKLEQNRSVLHLCANRQLNKQFTRAPLKAAHFPTNRRQQTGGWLLARPSSTFGSGGDHPQPRTLQLCPSSGLASLNSGEGTFKGDTAAKCVVVCSSSARASGTRGVRIDLFFSKN